MNIKNTSKRLLFRSKSIAFNGAQKRKTELKAKKKCLKKITEPVKTLEESEVKLAGIVDSVTDHMSMMDEEHTIVWANNIACELFGADLVGKKCYTAYHKRDKVCKPCLVSKCFQNGKVHHHETEVIAANGDRIIFWCTASVAARYKDGRPKMVVETSRNITHLRQIEKATRLAYAELNQIFHTVTDAMIVINKNFNILRINDAFSKTIDIDKDKIIGKKCYEAIPCSLYCNLGCPLNLVTTSKKPLEFEIEKEGKDGTMIPYFLTATPFWGHDGELAGIVASFKDITNRKQAEIRVQHRIEMEKLITNVSTQFINFSPNEIDNKINYALRVIAEFTGVNRSCVFLFSDEGIKIDNTYEWCAEGIEPQIGNLKGLSPKIFPWWMEKLNRFENIYIPFVADLPPEASAEKEILQSLVVMPLIVGKTLIGYLGFDSVYMEKTWAEEDIFLFKMIGEIFVTALKQKWTQGGLIESEEKLRIIFDTIKDGIIVLNKTGKVIDINKSVTEVLGYSVEDIIGKHLTVFKMFTLTSLAKIMNNFLKRISGKTFPPYEVEVYAKDRRKLSIEISANILRSKGKVIGGVAVLRNITARKQMEEEKRKIQTQLLQAQKIEAIGTLTGGVAHDFNNILTAIQGHTELAMGKVDQAHPVQDNLKRVCFAVDRAAELTEQLLLYSRRQPMKLTSLIINKIIDNELKMLNRLIGEDIVIETDLSSNLWMVQADKGNIEQVIMNLTVNARDAMPEGGNLTIKTENVILDKRYCTCISYARPGKFICLSVEDTGTGIENKIIQHIFNPFFSTKKKGEGTGLGLSVVYGVVKEHKGWINVYSEPGQGTIFKIYLPAVFEKSETEGEIEEKILLEKFQGNGKRILLVEDEKGVRELATTSLRENGYVVFGAANTKEALDIFEKEKGKFHLVFSDLVLPDQSGLELVDQLLSHKSKLQVLLSSGYLDKKSQWPTIRKRGFPFLQKPYTFADLLRTVKETLKDN